MDQSPDNPEENRLGPSINEASLVRAIRTSGYPLQGVVADKLKDGFTVTEEWGYIDRETKEHRSLDVLAFKAKELEAGVQACLALLIECKRSVHPYVFFRNVVSREMPRFPRISGLSVSFSFLKETRGNRVLQPSGSQLLGLAELPFVRLGPPICSAFGMAIAQGDKVSISGSDPYNSLILPLAKAMDHQASLNQPSGPNPRVLYPMLVLGVGVVDAPLLLVDDPRDPKPLLVPWVRVSRQEARPDGPLSKYVYYVVDIVHSSFVDRFVAHHLVPFFDGFASRATRQAPVLLRGGSVENLDGWTWDSVKPNG